ncbi:MAG TPA: cytochrome c maturation protein CcmE [Acidimicrobiales bacterium]|nr:cytochrome c maturation protein CcmE [Acidimicrobiales bacterium]
MTISAPPAHEGRGTPPVGGERAAAVAALRKARSARTRRRIALVGVVLLAAAGFLVYKALTSAIVYFKTAQQAVAERGTLGDSTFQIEGVVVPHTLRSTGPRTLSFSICSGRVHVPVENQGTPPQLFAPGVAVVLVGHFVGTSNVFSSNQILVKHSNSYVAAHPGRVQTGDAQRC